MKFILITLLFFHLSARADVEAVFSQAGDYAVILVQNNGDAKNLYNTMNVQESEFGEKSIFIKKINHIIGDSELNIECDYLKDINFYTCGISLNKSETTYLNPNANEISYELLNNPEFLISKFHSEGKDHIIYQSLDKRLLLINSQNNQSAFILQYN